ncbi:immunity protein TriTu family protein [Capnocytophaga gingivalis]
MIDVEPFIKEVLEKKIPEGNLRFFGEDNEGVVVDFETETHLKRFTVWRNYLRCDYEALCIATDELSVCKSQEFDSVGKLISIFNKFYHTAYSEIDTFINQLYENYRARLIDREEIANIIREDHYSKYKGNNYPYEKYLSLLWKEEYLNEKDIDLLDLCLFYQYIGEEIEVLGYWVTGHGGGTYEKFEAKGTLDSLKPQIQAFVERCYERYEEVMPLYISL